MKIPGTVWFPATFAVFLIVSVVSMQETAKLRRQVDILTRSAEAVKEDPLAEALPTLADILRQRTEDRRREVEKLRAEIAGLKERLGPTEALAGILRERMADRVGDVTRILAALDRLEQRVARIEALPGNAPAGRTP